MSEKIPDPTVIQAYAVGQGRCQDYAEQVERGQKTPC